MKLALSILFLSLSFSSFLRTATARGGLHSSYPPGIEFDPRGGSGRQLFEDKKSQKRVDVAQGYMTNSDLERAIKAAHDDYADLSFYSPVEGFFEWIISIGKSVNGVPLWVIEISDKPGEEEPEPAFKYIGNVHGDEPVGRELLILLANWICDNYLKDPLATSIVDNVHLHLLPSMNPDGFSLRRRGNANNVDLNRDFPDQGALVANYPWDGTQDKRKDYFACPDDETFRFLASVYSRSHYNMSLSKEFEGGITNGAFWYDGLKHYNFMYPIYGGMQDWNYINGGCFELTLEISDNKWPTANELLTLWEYNKMSMLNLIATVVKIGVRGRIFSSDGGRPLPGFIAIKGINSTVQASRAIADYHRLLSPAGRYEVTATAPGYKSKTTCIWLEEAGATNVDFVLDPEVNTRGIQVRSACDCSWGSMSIIWGTPFEVYLLLIVIVGFLLFLYKRRTFSRLKQRQLVGPKRPIVA
ncbi:hypothetical protein DVH24_037776 [Malus domestica]|uniref:Peptidase M14 domain-containing protein n=1 Tax=Malus domestica TaxID=3750 RepID=A0A498JZ15_MALDO|nr:hypothetical protein DVH24_037776 [Malus domestica]